MKDKLLQNEIEEIIDNQWITLSTAKDNLPRSIIVMPSRVESNRMILSNIQISKTIENIKENPKCFINIYISEKMINNIK